MRRNHPPAPPAPEPWNPDEWPDPQPLDSPTEATELDTPAVITGRSNGDDIDDIPTVPLAAEDGQPSVEPWVSEPRRAEVLSATPDSTSGPTPRRRSHRSTILIGVAAVVALAAIGLAAVLALGDVGGEGEGRGDHAMLTEPTMSSAPASSAVAPDCPTAVTGAVTTGRDAGDQSSGPGVIKAFQYAYYVRRSGAAARALATPTARVGKAEDMQGFIDALPPRTRHCLKITSQGKGLYGVELSEIPPGGGAPTVYRQNVQTTEADGKTWIVSIEPVDS